MPRAAGRALLAAGLAAASALAAAPTGGAATTTAAAAAEAPPPCDPQHDPRTAYVAVGGRFEAAALPADSPLRAACKSPIAFIGSGDTGRWRVGVLTGRAALLNTTAELTTTLHVSAMCGGVDVLCRADILVAVYMPLTPAPLDGGETPAPTPDGQLPEPAAAACEAVYGFDAATSSVYEGALTGMVGASACPDGATESFELTSAFQYGSGANLTLAPGGVFRFDAGDVPAMDHFGFNLVCAGTPKCHAFAYFSMSPGHATLPPLQTPAPTMMPAVSCGLGYAFQTVGKEAAVFDLAGQAAVAAPQCPPPAQVVFVPAVISDPLEPAAVLASVDADGNMTVTPRAFGWSKYNFSAACVPPGTQVSAITEPGTPLQWRCDGVASVLAIVPGHGTLPPATPAPPHFFPSQSLKCAGRCNATAWRAVFFKPELWDDSYVRADGVPVGSVLSSYTDEGNIVLTAAAAIGNMGVRFPTFAPLPESVGAGVPLTLTPGGVRGALPGGAADELLPFNVSCLARQPMTGAGEQVWSWDGAVNEAGGRLGELYASGHSYYQKFGGKHIACDTFADSCTYAPLMTPRAGGPWALAVEGCDATWTGTFSGAELLALRQPDGSPVFRPVPAAKGLPEDQVVVRGKVFSQVVKPRSWMKPAEGIMSRSAATEVGVVMREKLSAAWVPAKFDTSPFAAASVTRRSSIVARNDTGVPMYSLVVGYSTVLRPTERFPPAVASVEIAGVRWAAEAVGACGPLCDGLNLTQRACGTLATDGDGAPPCSALPLSVRPGPAGATACANKPYAPAGISGIGEMPCGVSGVNITFDVRVGKQGAAAADETLPFLPAGVVDLRVRATKGIDVYDEVYRVTIGAEVVGIEEQVTRPPATGAPTTAPTDAPSLAPTMAPLTVAPTPAPTLGPNETASPTEPPTEAPTGAPTAAPTQAPVTVAPTAAPTPRPTPPPVKLTSTVCLGKLSAGADPLDADEAPAAVCASTATRVFGEGDFASIVGRAPRPSGGLFPIAVRSAVAQAKVGGEVKTPIQLVGAPAAGALPWRQWASFVAARSGPLPLSGDTADAAAYAGLLPGALCGDAPVGASAPECTVTITVTFAVDTTDGAAPAVPTVVERTVRVNPRLRDPKPSTLVDVVTHQHGPLRRSTAEAQESSTSMRTALMAIGIAVAVAAIGVVAMYLDEDTRAALERQRARIASFLRLNAGPGVGAARKAGVDDDGVAPVVVAAPRPPEAAMAPTWEAEPRRLADEDDEEVAL